MVTDTYIGKVSDEILEKWDIIEDPFKILEDHRLKLIKTDWMTILAYGEKMFSDYRQVDWGSFAFTGEKEKIIEFVKNTRGELYDFDKGTVFPKDLEDGVRYAVVFIEIS